MKIGEAMENAVAFLESLGYVRGDIQRTPDLDRTVVDLL
jgi:hypothetical protein